MKSIGIDNYLCREDIKHQSYDFEQYRKNTSLDEINNSIYLSMNFKVYFKLII